MCYMSNVKSDTSNRKAVKRVLWSFALGLLYTIGFFVAFGMMWVDLTDRYSILEFSVSRIGQALLCTLFAPVTFTRLYGSTWALPFLFAFGFVGGWLILLLRQHQKDRISHVA